MTSAPPAIAIRDLVKRYAGNGAAPGKLALDGVSLDVPEGQIFGLLGPNGAGKSTLINILAGLVTKTAGSASIWGFDIDRDHRNAKRAIGIVPQEIFFDPFFTPFEVLENQGGFYGIAKANRRSEELLEAVRLADKRDAHARTLSGGMKRRLLIAKAMVHSPPILVLDEPTAGVDVDLRRQLWDLVTGLNAQGVTIVLTTHYLEEAEKLCDRIAIIDRGRVIADKTTRELVEMAREKIVRVTVERDLDAAPRHEEFAKAEMIDPRTLEITYDKDRTNAGRVLGELRALGYTIEDVTTREADLEEVFVELTGGRTMSSIGDPGRAGQFAHDLATRLFPINRSLTGPGTRETLAILAEHLPDLRIHEVPSGAKAFDWEVPDEWSVREAWIADEAGRRVVDFADHNLHLVGYSEPVDEWMDREALDAHLHSLPDQPDAIPYVTSYYKRRWGFCLTHEQREALPDGRYHVRVDSTLEPGVLNYGELVVPGASEEEVFLSTYVCHPSMANNELSGPVVATAIARWLAEADRRFTYRLVFIPETIGSIVYLSRNLDHLRERMIAGFNLTCIGDERAYSYLPSRAGDTLADRAARQALAAIDPGFARYSWLERGSDERQYCAPGVDLPVASIMRSKYWEYPEYHTSLDDLDLVTPAGLQGGFDAVRLAIECLETDAVLRVTVLGEPQLGKRGLYPNTSAKGSAMAVRTMMDLISYCDGERSLIEIGAIVGAPAAELARIARPLIENGLLERVR